MALPIIIASSLLKIHRGARGRRIHAALAIAKKFFIEAFPTKGYKMCFAIHSLNKDLSR